MKFLSHLSKAVSLALLIFLSASTFIFITPAGAVDATGVPDLSRANAVCMYNIDSGRILTSKNADQLIFPASTVKIMTSIVALELFGDCLDDTVTVTENMITETSGNSLGLSTGEVISYRSLLSATICGGYNDTALVLAHAAGGIDHFIDLMNAKAKELGAASTVYSNPTGLHSPDMVSTVRDILKIATYAQQSELFMALSSSASLTIPATNISAERKIYNKNNLISTRYTHEYFNSFAEGMSVGMTSEGGYCLVTSAKYKGSSYICIVMGAQADDQKVYSYTIANELISWAINGFGYVELMKAGSSIGISLPVELSFDTNKVELVIRDDVRAFVPVNYNVHDLVTYRTSLSVDSLKAPVAEGQEVGYLSVFLENDCIASVPIVCKHSVEDNLFLKVLSTARDIICSRIFLASIACFTVLMTAKFFIFPRISHLSNKTRRWRG